MTCENQKVNAIKFAEARITALVVLRCSNLLHFSSSGNYYAYNSNKYQNSLFLLQYNVGWIMNYQTIFMLGSFSSIIDTFFVVQRGMLAFETAQYDGILKKVSEFNNSLLSDTVSCLLQHLIIVSSHYKVPARACFYFHYAFLHLLKISCSTFLLPPLPVTLY